MTYGGSTQEQPAAIVVAQSAEWSHPTSQTLDPALTQWDLEQMQQVGQQHQGTVLQIGQDWLCLKFTSAVQAVQFALQVQHHRADMAVVLPAPDRLSHKIGIHWGRVQLSSTGVVGEGIEIARALQAMAEPGGICLSQAIYEAARLNLPLQANYVGLIPFQALQVSVPVYRLPPAEPFQAIESPAEPVEPLIGNRYRILNLLGRGGFGRTYLVADRQRFDHRCVLKEFAPASRSEYAVNKARELFEREARVLYEIDHPQIPKFLAWFIEQDQLYLVQEYVQGKTYATLLRERQHQGKAFSQSEVLRWLLDLLPVLDYLHQRQIVHRDISPDNVMLPQQQSRPVLIDFGLVKQAVNLASQHSERPGSQASFVGKFGYAPPEQIRMGQCYPASDLYALAVTAVVLLTGREPSLLLHRDTLEWHWRTYTTVDDDFAEVINRLLQEKPRDRYASAAATLSDLEQLLPQASNSFQSVSQRSAPRSNTAPAATTPLSSSPTIFHPAFLEACRQQLACCVGPIAQCILEDSLSQNPQLTPNELIHLLSLEIPNRVQAAQFKTRLSEFLTTAPGITAAIDAAATAPAKPPAAAPELDPALVHAYRQTLARCIGPMASLILEDALARQPRSPEALLAAILSEIPDKRQADAFRRAINAQ